MSKVRSEIQEKLAFTPKETDIYKIHQSGDLANLDGLDDAALQQLPSLRRLRDALYSTEFRDCLCRITGSRSVSGKKTDMAINVYTPGCHLLCHDDVIGSRRISYILYLTDPDHPWQKEWGGALRLYPTEELPAEGDAKVLVPKADPSVSIPPAFNQLSFFAVQPGQSFHDVEEVYSSATPDTGKAPDEHRVRMAISGWYHIPQEGEDGYKEGEEAELAKKSSLAQLQDKGDIHDRPQPNITPYPISALPNPVDDRTPEPNNFEEDLLSEEELTFLLKYIAPSYLTPDTLESVSSTFGDECSIVLDRFLSRTFSESLEILEHQDGTPAPAKALDTWDTARPPHKNRYLYDRAQSPPKHKAPRDTSQDVKPMAALQDLLENLIPSSAFRKWLQFATGYTIRSHDVVARRFRRGYDYTLAQSYDLDEPRLEVCLCLTPSGIEKRDRYPLPPVGEDHKGTIEDQAHPTTEESSKPVIKDASLPSTEDSHKPDGKDTSLPPTKDSSKANVKDTSLPTTKDSPKPDEKGTSLPSTVDSSKPDAKDASHPTTGEAPRPDVKDTPIPTTKEPSRPETQQLTKAAIEDSSEPDAKATSLPSTEEPRRPASQKFIQPDAEAPVQSAAKDISSPATENPSQSTQESKPVTTSFSTQASTAPDPSSNPESKPDTTSFSTQASTAPDPLSNPDPDPEHGGYLAYMAGDDVPDDASDGVEVPQDLSTGGRATKAKTDPAIYQTAKDDEDDGVLFSMPSCWNKLGIVLRDRGTMRFVKYLSKSAPSDRWDIFGEFEIEPPPEEEGDVIEQEERDEEEATTVHDDDETDDLNDESEDTDSSDY